MHITIDNFPIHTGLISVILACVCYLVAGIIKSSPESRLSRTAETAYYVSATAVAYASLYLLQQLIAAQRYDISYIFFNSGPRDELIYRISAFWAGQQGSMLFWALVTMFVGLALVRRLRSAPLMLSFWCSVQVFFLTILVVDDVFKPLAEYQPGMTGSGLMPLLKNPWMAIHPPVIFLGYALLIVPAAFAVAALVTGDARRWANRSLPWALSGWVSLTAGLVLGMVWSYEVLGWGGYWGWDPVENASLVPWLTATALVHGLVLQRYRGIMARTNIVLAMVTFLLVIYATYLTRSGVLAKASVHSFADTPAYAYLLGFLIFYTVLSAGMIAFRWKSVSGETRALAFRSKDFSVILGVVVTSLFALVVLAGTSYPLFMNGSIGPQFYNRMSAPLAVAIAILLAFAPLMKWSRPGTAEERNAATAALGSAFIMIAVIALAAGLLVIARPERAGEWFGWLVSRESSAARFAVQGLLLLLGSALIALAVSGRQAIKSGLLRSGAHIAHAGVALFLIGVIFSSTGTSTRLELEKDGKPQRASGYAFSYHGKKRHGQNKESILISAKRGTKHFSAPLHIEYGQQGMVQRPYVKAGLLSDLYISPFELLSTTVTATASMTDNGWVSMPTPIPGTGSAISLAGMQYEAQTAIIEYIPPDGNPQEITVSASKPATIDGFTFSFISFMSKNMGEMSHMTVGATLGVAGAGLKEVAIVDVTRKHMMSMVWLGTALIPLGGIIAVLRRRLENAKVQDGLLPDNDGSDR